MKTLITYSSLSQVTFVICLYCSEANDNDQTTGQKHVSWLALADAETNKACAKKGFKKLRDSINGIDNKARQKMQSARDTPKRHIGDFPAATTPKHPNSKTILETSSKDVWWKAAGITTVQLIAD